MPRYTSRTRRYSRRPKRTFKRRTYGRRRFAGRNDNKVYNFVQHTEYIQGALTTDQYIGLDYRINQISTNLGSIQTLYDQVKLVKVRTVVRPFNNVSDANNFGLDCIRSVIDYDGSFPTTVAQMNGYQTCKTTQMGKVHARTFYPCYSRALSAGAGEIVKTSKVWLDSNGAGIAEPAYGLCIFFPAQTNNTVVISGSTSVAVTPCAQWSVKTTYWIQCRNVR